MLRFAAALIATFLAAGVSQAATIKVTQGTGTGMIFVEGDIAAGDAATFSTAADRFRQATVVLESNGGNLQAGIAMGTEVRRRGFSTLVPNGATCASVCASIWLGGANRQMGSASRIGFHSAYLIVAGKPEASEEANALHRDYFRELGLREDTIRYITMAGPGSMTWMTADAAAAVGIDYSVVGGRGPAATTTAVASAYGKATVYRDLNLRAASFNEAQPAARGCRMLLLSNDDNTGESFIAIDVPRRGAPGVPGITVYAKNLQDAGQPRVVSIAGDVYELERGSNWGRVNDFDSRRIIGAMQSAGRFFVTAMRIDGTTAMHEYRSKGIAAAVERTARDCGKKA